MQPTICRKPRRELGVLALLGLAASLVLLAALLS
jgi:hypothetical protein